MRDIGLTSRPPLDARHFHVVVIGGGINGVAIARECARAGRTVLILEQRDFGAGTTSRSTRIIHGGLRYLEHGDISLVRESLRERERLLRERPHLVTPLDFLLLLDPGGERSALEIRFGLWLYKLLARGAKCAPGQVDVSSLERWLDRGHRWSMFSYDDAQCEFPERLVAEWLFEAVAAGAVARNHAQVLEVRTKGGRVRGVLLRDSLSGEEATVSAECVVNAAGPWADHICRQSEIDTRQQMVGGVRGSHLVFPSFPGAPKAAVYAEALDGRPMFIVPWNGQLLVGTTEIPDDSDPSNTLPSEAETEYLFDSLVLLFPRVPLSWSDIRYSYAGVRPLPYAPHLEPAAVPRHPVLRDHADDGAAGLISIIGGKLTTAAALARACARKIGVRVPEPLRLPEPTPEYTAIDFALHKWAAQVAGSSGVGNHTALALARWHGPRAAQLAAWARADAALGRRLCPHTAHIAAEALEAAQSECAVTLGDILLRRVPVALDGTWSDECARTAASAVGEVLGWNRFQVAAQLEAFHAERREFLRPPQRVTPAEKWSSPLRKRVA